MPRTAPPSRSTQSSRLRGTSSQKACSAQRGTSDESTRNPRTFDGFPLAFLVTALTASLIPYPSMWQVMGLGALWFLTLFGGKR